MPKTVKIHPSAIIDPSAELAETVTVGPYTVIGADVEIGAGSQIGAHVVINGPTKMGVNNQIFQFASVGEACQDKKYKGEPTALIIGNGNVIREFATMHRGTVQDESKTVVGNENLFMAYTHVAHDCVIANRVIMSNNATLAGHAHVGDGAVLGGFTGVHQFCKIGAYSMAGMFSAITKDVPAFVMVQGNLAKPFGLNVEGMRRRGSGEALIKLMKRAYRVVYRQGLALDVAKKTLQSLLIEIKEGDAPLEDQTSMVEHLLLFIESIESSNRGLIR